MSVVDNKSFRKNFINYFKKSFSDNIAKNIEIGVFNFAILEAKKRILFVNGKISIL